VLVVRLAGPAVGPALAVARGALLVGLAGLAWVAASAYARMANLAVEAELELGRRERLGRALLDALTDPTAVLDAQGRIVAANQAWVRFAATDLTGLALAEVGQSYPAACEAAAAAGYDGLEPAAKGVRAVLAGEASLFRCRYQTPNGSGPYEVTVTLFAEGDGAGAVVTHRPHRRRPPTRPTAERPPARPTAERPPTRPTAEWGPYREGSRRREAARPAVHTPSPGPCASVSA
jgi:PAS domain-containing protein